jgi:hypothetical protein
MQPQELLDKIQQLPPEKIAVIEDFVEFLHHRDDDRYSGPQKWDSKLSYFPHHNGDTEK